ncbi:divergent polysaccharide deacetylase family protein [Paenibacillus daejeonensis]|uniref:divergent polysaccharide deacetylase family protein n=1 Tax=Paenibacillus daejeonensis TaxID=135193 RepID=UPI00037373D5
MSYMLRLSLLTFVLLSVSLTGSAPRLTIASTVANQYVGQPAVPANGQQSGKRIAIVIDDFGNGMKGTKEMLSLPIPLTVAVMPFLPTSKADAEEAHRLGHEVILHMPMEPNRGKREWLGPGALTTDLDDAEIRKRVEAAIADIPFAVGMNNHMGSKVTADRRMMRIVMEVCRENELFYLDSRTTHKSVIPEVAAEYRVPILTNQLFLDDQYHVSHIRKQLGLLDQKLSDQSEMIAIGHVGPSGLNVAAALRQWSSAMKEQARFVTASELISSVSRDQQILP